MARGINIARIPGQSPNIQSMVVTAAQTFKKGALVIDVSAGTISECGADPSAVLGVAMEAAFTKPGNSMNFSPSYITGGAPTECSIAIADRRTVFSMRGVNGGTDPVTPTQTMVGESYGVAKSGDDWYLDIAETSAKVFKIVDIDIDNKIFFCKFLEAVLSLP